MIDAVADKKRRREIAEQAGETAARIAADVAKKSADVGSRVGEKVSEVAEAARESDVATRIATDVAKRSAVARAALEEGHDVMEHHGKDRGTKRPRRHRIRNSAVLAGAGAAAAYFLDPKAGAERRAAARRRTSTSAQVVGEGLDRAAHAAHQTAEATKTDPMRTPTQSNLSSR